jgi:hypothetical protein
MEACWTQGSADSSAMGAFLQFKSKLTHSRRNWLTDDQNAAILIGDILLDLGRHLVEKKGPGAFHSLTCLKLK